MKIEIESKFEIEQEVFYRGNSSPGNCVVIRARIVGMTVIVPNTHVPGKRTPYIRYALTNSADMIEGDLYTTAAEAFL